MLGLYRTAALHERIAKSAVGANLSLRSLFAGMHLGHLAPLADEWHDVDTWADHEAWQTRLRGASPPGGIMES